MCVATCDTIEIKGQSYGLEILPGEVRVIRLSGPTGQVYDVAELPERAVCDCPSFTRGPAGDSAEGCKHVQACVEAGLVANRALRFAPDPRPVAEVSPRGEKRRQSWKSIDFASLAEQYAGVPLSRVAEETGIPKSTLSYRFRQLREVTDDGRGDQGVAGEASDDAGRACEAGRSDRADGASVGGGDDTPERSGSQDAGDAPARHPGLSLAIQELMEETPSGLAVRPDGETESELSKSIDRLEGRIDDLLAELSDLRHDLRRLRLGSRNGRLDERSEGRSLGDDRRTNRRLAGLQGDGSGLLGGRQDSGLFRLDDGLHVGLNGGFDRRDLRLVGSELRLNAIHDIFNARLHGGRHTAYH